MILSDTIQPFLTYSQVERLNAAATQEKYQDCFRTWIVPALGNGEVEKISLTDILELREAMFRKGLSVARQYSVLMTLKLLLKFCRVHLKLTCLDPAEIRLPSRPKPNVQYLNNQEVQRLVDFIDTHTFTGLRLRALVELILATGVRLSEAISLTRESIDRDVNEITITGKGGKRRVIFLTERSKAWIRHYLKQRYDDHPALFVTTGVPVRPLAKEDVSRFFVHLRQRAKFSKKITPHTLRHTFCTNLLHNGADITFIKDLAGHQNIQTTARYYLGVDNNVLRRVVRDHLNYNLDNRPPASLASA